MRRRNSNNPRQNSTQNQIQNQSQPQPFTTEYNNNNIRNTITFNYSENFNRITELNTENHTTWRRNMLYLLNINKLTKYVLIPIIKKLKKKDIKGNIKYIEDQFDDTFVYKKNTTINDIDNDITIKWIIINSLGEYTQSIIEGNEKSAYEIWKLLKESFTKSKEQRKIELTNKIENLKFNNKDISIFIANLQILFTEIAKIDSEISDSSKIGILNRWLPESLR